MTNNFNCEELKPGDVCITRGGWEATYMGMNPYTQVGDRYGFAHDRTKNVIMHLHNGRRFSDVCDPFDIIRKKPEKVVRWLNIYASGDGATFLYYDRESADRGASKHRIACVKVEFEPGEGL